MAEKKSKRKWLRNLATSIRLYSTNLLHSTDDVLPLLSAPKPRDILGFRALCGDNLPRDPIRWRNIQDQIHNCDSHHSCYRPTNIDSYVPTRLLDVRAYRENIIKLVLTAGQSLDEMTKYIALSYCWGQSNNFLLTTDTLASHQRGFALSELPLTLQDAVRVTYDLGVDYLWIDALCIIQGCSEDWIFESARMGSVFGNAYLTIYAANSKDCADGFFDLSTQIVSKPYYSSWSEEGEIVPFQYEPLNSRAWAFQEWSLSPRQLIFASFNIYFLCQKVSTLPFMKRFGPLREDASGNSRNWQRKVVNYAARNLTQPGDKLPALTGIAEDCQKQSQGRLGRYLAGIWENELLSDLLWRQDDPLRMLPIANRGRPTTWRAPSWTWASIDGNIAYLGLGSILPMAEVIQADTTPASNQNAFGEVLDGFIVIDGQCMEFDEVEVSGDGDGFLNFEADFRLHGCLNFDTDDEKVWCSKHSVKLFFLAIAKYRSSSNIWGIVLCRRREEPLARPKFQRVGLFYAISGWDYALEPRSFYIT